jgi:hypothetical protein
MGDPARDPWQTPFHHQGSALQPIKFDGKIMTCIVVKAFSEDELSRETTLTKNELLKGGFKRFTVSQMKKLWDIGQDSIELMAERAVLDDRIHNDYVFKRRLLKKHLWARLKDG